MHTQFFLYGNESAVR